jgi:flagellin-like protein
MCITLVKKMNLLMSRKGVSPIIAELLIIVIAVAAAVVAYAFVTGFIGTSSGTSNQQGSMSFDSYQIIDPNTIVIYVRNTGTKVLTISNVYFDGDVGTTATYTINPSEVLQLTTDSIATNLDNGQPHQLRIVCSDGTPLQISIIKN